MHYLIKKAFEIFPDKDVNAKLKYSKAFKGYNANVKYSAKNMEFRLSHNWKEVSDEIKIGLLQSLLNKVYNSNINSINIDLYEIFLKKLPILSPKTKSDPVLEESFNRVNKEYFNGLMIMPNLEYGGRNFHTLGTYEYTSDTIRISRILVKDNILLDFVMYHEMLHKKFKYKNQGKRTLHHSKEFRMWEKKYKEPNVEEKLKKFLTKEKFMQRFF